MPNIIGSSRNFKQPFKDVKTGEVIDNWKKWERAGYRNLLNSPHLTNEMKERAKEKMDKIKFYQSRGIDPTGK